MHFGILLKTLREARGMTQQGLADAAQVSDFTIYNAERSESCPWRRSTASSVLAAIERVAPLNKNERENYLQMAKLEALARLGTEMEQRRLSELDALKAKVASSRVGYDTSDDADMTTLHEWLQDIYETPDGKSMLFGALVAIAAHLKVNLSAPVELRHAKRPVWYMTYPEAPDERGGMSQVRVAHVPEPKPKARKKTGS